jgi:hypothetical protein
MFHLVAWFADPATGNVLQLPPHLLRKEKSQLHLYQEAVTAETMTSNWTLPGLDTFNT